MRKQSGDVLGGKFLCSRCTRLEVLGDSVATDVAVLGVRLSDTRK